MVTENFRGAILMVLSMALFAMEDMFIKMLSMDLPFVQVLGLAGLLCFLSFALILKLRGGRVFTRDALRPAVLARSVSEAVGATGFVVSLALTDMSSTSAILQALPLAIVLGAAVFLREPVGWRRWSAICLGFLGVLMVVRPGASGFQPVSLFAVLSVLALAVRDLVTRGIPAHVRSDQLSAMAFLAVLVSSVCLGWALGQGFVMPDAGQWLLLMGCVVFGVGGYTLLVASTRLSEASALAPYRYSRLVFALVIAYLAFDERPDLMTILGAIIIVGSGCYTMWREARLRRRQLRAAGFVAPS